MHFHMFDLQSHLVFFTTQQWRLLPYVAAMYAHDCFANFARDKYIEFLMGNFSGDKSKRQVKKEGTVVCCMKATLGKF